MRRVLAVVVLLARPALADGQELALTPLKPLDTAPDLALGSEATCGVPALITTRTLVVGTALVAVMHDCGQVGESTRLAIRGEAARWFATNEIMYQDQSAHMTDAPAYRHLLDESFSTGTLADGAIALVHRVTTQRGTRCWKDSHCPPGAESATVSSVVEICRVDVPACDHIEFTCPARGCTSVALRAGTLAMQTDRGPELGHVR